MRNQRQKKKAIRLAIIRALGHAGWTFVDYVKDRGDLNLTQSGLFIPWPRIAAYHFKKGHTCVLLRSPDGVPCAVLESGSGIPSTGFTTLWIATLSVDRETGSRTVCWYYANPFMQTGPVREETPDQDIFPIDLVDYEGY